MIRVPKRLSTLVLGISGLFGMRTPPEPEAIAQTVPPPNADGSDGPSGKNVGQWEPAPNTRLQFPNDVPLSEAREKARRKNPPVK